MGFQHKLSLHLSIFGAVVYGNMKSGDEAKEARNLLKSGEVDLSGLDAEINLVRS